MYSRLRLAKARSKHEDESSKTLCEDFTGGKKLTAMRMLYSYAKPARYGVVHARRLTTLKANTRRQADISHENSNTRYTHVFLTSWALSDLQCVFH